MQLDKNMDTKDNSGYLGIYNVTSHSGRCGVVSVDQRYAARVNGQAHSAGPDTIPGLVGWFTAESIIDTANAGKLGFWRNLVGDNHAVCTVEESKPLYYTSGGSDNNYKPYIHFGGDGSETNWLTVNEGVFLGGDLSRSMAIVYRPLTYASEQRFCGQGYWTATTPISTSNANTAFYFRIVSETQSITWYTRGSEQTVDTVAFSSAFHVAVLQHYTPGAYPRSYYCYQDGVLVHYRTANIGSTAGIVQNPFMFGSAGGFAASSSIVHNFPFYGDICEFVAYDAFLSEAQRGVLTTYLMTKYGVSAP